MWLGKGRSWAGPGWRTIFINDSHRYIQSSITQEEEPCLLVQCPHFMVEELETSVGSSSLT